jgi:hypothetical protein
LSYLDVAAVVVQHGQPPSAAPTTASAASQQGPVENRERTAGAPEVPRQSGQLGVERLQPFDPIGDVPTALHDHAGQLGDRIRAVPGMAPARDPGGILERDIEPRR